MNLTTGDNRGGHAHNDKLTSIENIIGTNYALGDILTGDAGDNVIIGLGGGDRINGNGGNDTVDYSGSNSRVSVNLTTGDNRGGHAHNDKLTSIENIIGTNYALGDILTGDAGDNVIIGLGGGDRINGNGGNDTLIGGLGSDRFIFNLAFGHDVVTDFQDDIDTIDFRAFGATATSRDVAGDAIYNFADGSQLTVENITVVALADDIIF